MGIGHWALVIASYVLLVPSKSVKSVAIALILKLHLKRQRLLHPKH
ncbi:MAG: hypothetical protein V7K27_24630 [Nostoc sp.]